MRRSQEKNTRPRNADRIDCACPVPAGEEMRTAPRNCRTYVALDNTLAHRIQNLALSRRKAWSCTGVTGAEAVDPPVAT
eukprot:6755109-Alexandrium_andersonii.AAC.1